MITKNNSILSSASQSLYEMNANDIIREKCLAREDCLKTEQVAQRFSKQVKVLQQELMKKDAAIAEKDNTIAEKDAAIAEKDNTIAEKDAAIAEQSAQLLQSEAEIAQLRKLVEKLQK